MFPKVMRSVVLDSNINEPLLSQARARMGEEFISSVRAFLSLLAVAKAEDLYYVQSKLLPHKLSFDRDPPASPARETPQATPNEFLSRSHTTEDAQPSDALPVMGGWQLHPAGSALTSPETADSRDLFAKYTTLEDGPSSHEQAASVDTEMPDRGEDTTVAPTASCSTSHSPTLPTSENASDTLTTAADSNEPTNNIMNDVAETNRLPWSSQAERHTEFSSASPSQASSNWSLSPVVDSMYTWSASSPPPTRYVRDVKRLDSLYGGSSARGVKNIQEIIKLGDSFLREDAVSFIESFRHGWGREGLWYRPPLSNPTTGSSIVERMLKSLRCAETVEHDSIVDPVRLRMARIFLYQYFEQKRIDVKDSNLPNPLSQGKDISSVVLDVILEDMYGSHDEQVGLRVRDQRRESLKYHKKLGKRWSILAAHLGIGIIITCSRSLEIHMNNKTFTERMIIALLTYILNVYPQGVRANQMADPFVQCMMEGASPSTWPAAETLAAIDGYKQQKEKECNDEKDEWQPVEPPKHFVRLISM